MIRLNRMALAVGLALAAGAAQAQIGNDWFHLSGFGTAALIKNTSDNTYYRINSIQPSGARDGWDGGPLNRLGAQASLTPLSWLEGTLQMVSQRRYDDSYNPTVEWGFIKVKPHKDVAIRLGRMALPAFMVSDSRNVGYVNTMTTPPVDVYTQVPATKYDGADLTWRLDAGPVVVNLNPYLGRRREVAGGGIVVNLDKIRGMNVTAEWESWTLRGGYMTTELYIRNQTSLPLWACMRGESNALSAGCSAYAAAAPVATQIANELDIQHKDTNFAGIGLQYDNGKLLGAAEYTTRESDSSFPDTKAWYVMGGYRWGKFTPYAAVSRLKNTSPTDEHRLDGLSLGALDPLNSVVAAQTNNVLRGLANDQQTLTAGVRWDFYKNTAFKLQYDRVKIKDNLGYAYKESTGSSGSSPLMHVYSATVDFVF